MTKRPNVVFLFADDQRFDTISALGHPDIRTPHLDALARSGVAFTQAHIPGGTVGAVCMPSRAMLHTGRTLFRLQQDGATVPDEHILMGEAFRQAGYRTCGIGKWHNGTSAYARSFTEGDEIFFGGMADHWNVPACRFDPTGAYDRKRKIIDDPYRSNRAREERCDHIHPGKHSSELFTDCAVRWLENSADAAGPFFLYVSYMAPHDPRSMPNDFLKLYDPDDIRLPDNFMESHPFDYGVSGIRDERLAASPRSAEEIRRHIAEYYAMIAHLDHELGRIVDALKRTGQHDDTLIVFAGDNGLALGQHGLMGKQSAYEHSVRVPLLLAGPGLPAGERRDAYVYLLDLFPTLCELTGLEIPSSVEGKSLVPVIRDAGRTVRDSLYLAYADCVRAVKDARYKLIEYRTEKLQRTQLFDLASDPAETVDLYGRDGYGAIANELSNKLLADRDAWGDREHPKGRRFWELYEAT